MKNCLNPKRLILGPSIFFYFNCTSGKFLNIIILIYHWNLYDILTMIHSTFSVGIMILAQQYIMVVSVVMEILCRISFLYKLGFLFCGKQIHWWWKSAKRSVLRNILLFLFSLPSACYSSLVPAFWILVDEWLDPFPKLDKPCFSELIIPAVVNKYNFPWHTN